MAKFLNLFVVLSTTLLLINCSQEKESNQQQNNGRTLSYERSVTFFTADDDSLTSIEVAIADDDKERSQGLMDVRNMPSDKGMLFIFEENQPRSFWMANTPLSLDIIFVNDAYEIVRIHHSANPYSENNFESGQPAKYVIETNGGFCISHDIQEGMKVNF